MKIINTVFFGALFFLSFPLHAIDKDDFLRLLDRWNISLSNQYEYYTGTQSLAVLDGLIKGIGHSMAALNCSPDLYPGGPPLPPVGREEQLVQFPVPQGTQHDRLRADCERLAKEKVKAEAQIVRAAQELGDLPIQNLRSFDSFTRDVQRQIEFNFSQRSVASMGLQLFIDGAYGETNIIAEVINRDAKTIGRGEKSFSDIKGAKGPVKIAIDMEADAQLKDVLDGSVRMTSENGLSDSNFFFSLETFLGREGKRLVVRPYDLYSTPHRFRRDEIFVDVRY